MSWQQQITQQISNLQAFYQLMVSNAKNVLTFPSASSLNGEDFLHVSQDGVDKKASLTLILAYLQENNLFVENYYDTMSGTNPLLTQQSQQTTGRIQYVENAFGFPDIADGDYAYFEKLDTNTQTYSDYRKLSADEVAIIESSQAWQTKTVRFKDTAVVDYTSLVSGYIYVLNDDPDITDLIFDVPYSEIIAKAQSLATTENFYLNIYNATKNINIRATITEFTTVDTNKVKVTITGVLDAEIDVEDTLHLGLPINYEDVEVRINGLWHYPKNASDPTAVTNGQEFRGFPTPTRFVSGIVLDATDFDIDDDTKARLIVNNYY